MDEFNGQNAVNLPPQPGEALPEGEFIPSLGIDDELLRMDGALDLEQFQVVRREFFAHLQEPSVTFNNCKFYVNAACLRKFPTADFVQVLVNQETKILALRPCHEGDRDSFMWCSMSKGKRVPRQTTGKVFSAKMFSLMNWNPDYRYKMLGKVVYAKGEYLIVFDLTATEVYQKTFREGEKPKVSRTPVFPAEWQEQFGMPLKEHQQSLQINIFDGYAVFAIKDQTKGDSEAQPQATPGQLAIGTEQEGFTNG